MGNNYKKNDPVTGFFIGAGVGIVAALIMAGVGILLETEISWLIVVGTYFAGAMAGSYLTNPFVGGIFGAIFSVTTYVAYIIILAIFGYGYTEGDAFDTTWLVVSLISGAYGGYKAAKDDD